MVAALNAMIVITCPHCGTRYQLPPDTIGKGRKVACAHCGETWMAEATRPPRETPKPALREVPKPRRPEPVPRPGRPEPTRTVEEPEERKLDRAFEDEEAEPVAEAAAPPSSGSDAAPPAPEILRSIASIKEAIAPWLHRPPSDGDGKTGAAGRDVTAPVPAATRNTVRARLNQISAALPAARLRRSIRLIAVALLFSSLSALVMLRTEIVRMQPNLAGLYALVGLEVNVIGLDFADVSTVKSKRGKAEILTITATIFGIEPHTLPVPPVLVTLYDAAGTQVYQWSTVTREPDIAPGETIHFAAELTAPPPSAVRAELRFDEAALARTPQTQPDAAGTPSQPSPPTDGTAPAQTTSEDASHHG